MKNPVQNVPAVLNEQPSLDARQIFAERVKVLYRLSYPTSLLTAGVVSGLYAVLWKTLDNTVLYLLLLIVVITVARVLLTKTFYSAAPLPARAAHWAKLFALGSTSAGFAWGLLGLALLPEHKSVYEVLAILVTVGVASAAVVPLSAFRSIYVAFLLPCTVPVTLGFLLQGDSEHLSLATLMLVYMGGITSSSFLVNRGIVENIKIRYENRNLAQELALKRQVETINHELKTEISERQHAEERIWHLAYHDTLTGLPNRMLLQDRLSRALTYAQRRQGMIGILFIDLDRFKTVNDSLGHGMGDRLLQAVAERLLTTVRSGDTVARRGGDEFVLVLPEIADPGAAVQVASHILESLSRPFKLDKQVLYATPSIGISIYPEDGEDVDTLLKHADIAMYAAKEAGRARHQRFLPKMNQHAQELLSLESRLRRAIERSELVLHYQPEMHLLRGNIVAVEALVRWQHPDLGLLTPDRFIQIAVDSGLIVPLGEWVLKKACAQLKEWHASGQPKLRVAVNVSANQVKQDNFVELVLRVLQDVDLEPKYLELEITEGVLMDDTSRTLNILQELHSLGVRIAIDDFGTGYSTLVYLKRFPIDRIKIDRSLVTNISVERRDEAAIASAIIAMAHSLKLEVVAEGIETREELDCLISLLCDEGQGFYICCPLTVERCTEFLKSHAEGAVYSV
ncbi:MAG: EAL domain-containing protein [Gammaproteobacteria bacterium]